MTKWIIGSKIDCQIFYYRLLGMIECISLICGDFLYNVVCVFCGKEMKVWYKKGIANEPTKDNEIMFNI